MDLTKLQSREALEIAVQWASRVLQMASIKGAREVRFDCRFEATRTTEEGLTALQAADK